MSQAQMHLTIVRHGNTYDNNRWRVAGNTDSPLNSNGKHQANLVAKRLQNDHFDQVCSSDLSRAFDTAVSIVRLNNDNNDEKRIEKYPELRERHFGVAEKTMILQHYSNAKKAGFKNRYEMTGYVPEGAESDEDVRRRVALFIKNLVEKRSKIDKPDWRVLITSHGITMREIFLCLIQDYGCTGIPDKLCRDKYTLAKIPNTAVNEFSLTVDRNNGTITGGKCTLLKCKKHLDSPYEIVNRISSYQEKIIYYFRFFVAIILYLLSKFGLWW